MFTKINYHCFSDGNLTSVLLFFVPYLCTHNWLSSYTMNTILLTTRDCLFICYLLPFFSRYFIRSTKKMGVFFTNLNFIQVGNFLLTREESRRFVVSRDERCIEFSRE